MTHERRQRNIDFIFDSLGKGEDPDKLILELEERERQQREGDWGRERGDMSERVVRNALQKLPIVRSIRITAKYSQEDRDQVDIEAKVNKISLIDKVKIQVKSSDVTIRDVKRALKNENNFTDWQLQEWLWEEGRIFINGDKSHLQIQQQFSQELARMSNYRVVKKGKEEQESGKTKEERPTKALDAWIKDNRLPSPSFRYITKKGKVTCTAKVVDQSGKEIVTEGEGETKKKSQDNAIEKLLTLINTNS